MISKISRFKLLFDKSENHIAKINLKSCLKVLRNMVCLNNCYPYFTENKS